MCCPSEPSVVQNRSMSDFFPAKLTIWFCIHFILECLFSTLVIGCCKKIRNVLTFPHLATRSVANLQWFAIERMHKEQNILLAWLNVLCLYCWPLKKFDSRCSCFVAFSMLLRIFFNFFFFAYGESERLKPLIITAELFILFFDLFFNLLQELWLWSTNSNFFSGIPDFCVWLFGLTYGKEQAQLWKTSLLKQCD